MQIESCYGRLLRPLSTYTPRIHSPTPLSFFHRVYTRDVWIPCEMQPDRWKAWRKGLEGDEIEKKNARKGWNSRQTRERWEQRLQTRANSFHLVLRHSSLLWRLFFETSPVFATPFSLSPWQTSSFRPLSRINWYRRPSGPPPLSSLFFSRSRVSRFLWNCRALSREFGYVSSV